MRVRDRVVGDRAPTATRYADDDRGLWPREWKSDRIIDRGRDVASGFEAGAEVVIARLMMDALERQIGVDRLS